MFDFDVRDASTAARHAVLGFSTVKLDSRVTEIARGPALTLAPETSVATAIKSMRLRRRGAAIVVRNQRPLGVIVDRDILAQCGGDIDDLWAVPIEALMTVCTEPVRDTDTVATALQYMCAHRQWHVPIACSRGLFVGALDIADISLWLRDRLTVISVEAAFT